MSSPNLRPPASTVGIVGWVRANLFSSIASGVMTLLFVLLGVWLIPPALDWLVFSAVFSGGNEVCRANPDVACWPFVAIRLPQFFYGFYQESERWRVDLAAFIFVIGLVWTLFGKLPFRKVVAGVMLFVFPIVAWFLLYGFVLDGTIFGFDYLALLGVAGERPYALLPIVRTNSWGGFSLTLIIALTGIVVSLPLGVLLALGRQSKLSIIRVPCVFFIEFWRGIPIVTVLFMASVMLPLFLPEGMDIDLLLRALLGFALLESAYMAEVIRGGLQAIPKGQIEGARSLGLSYWTMMRLIVLPQALKIVIPGIVNTFIDLFKDTTLVLVIGLLELLGVVKAAIADPDWSIRSIPYTGYAFVATVFWVCCFSMSLYSRQVERKLRTGHKH